MLSLSEAELRRLARNLADGPDPSWSADPTLPATGEVAGQLLAALHVMRSSVMLTDAQLDRPGPLIRYVNPSFTALTGYTAAEVIGRDPRFLQGPLTDRAVLTRLRSDLERTGSFEGRAINYRKDGRPFVMSWRIAEVLDHRGTLTGYLAVQEDATEAWLAQLRADDAVAQLQAALLPPPPAPADGVDLGVSYLAAHGYSRCGGDWFDTVDTGERLHLVVGDVSGHGAGAAAIMGQLRFALRAQLLAGTDPGEAVEHLRHAVLDDHRLRGELTVLATLAIVTLDRTRSTASVITCGHPDVVIAGDGGVRRVRSDHLLLGIESDRRSRPVAAHLDPGDLVALYSDGLVDRPGTSIDGAIDRLGALLLERRTDHPTGLARDAVHQLVGESPGDDTVLLLARIT